MGFKPLEFLLSKVHPDFNRNGIDDIKELKDQYKELQAAALEALQSLDYKTILVHANDIADAIRHISFLAGEIGKLTTTAEVKAATELLFATIRQFIALLQSFATVHKVAMIEKTGGNVA